MSTQRDNTKPPDTRLNIRIPTAMLEQLHAAAAADGINLSSWVKRLLTIALRERA